MDLRQFGNRLFAGQLTMLFAGALLVTSAFAQDNTPPEPYSVFVAKDKIYARCGPSSEYYRTDPLSPGQQLDVYLETPDGWLGVRPPKNSFCWIPASAVTVNAGGQSAVVIEEKTVCWIGTHLGRARQYRWQVQLAEGEKLTILGRSERDGPDGPQMWFRIVPPNGEFRWVRSEDVVDSAEKLVKLMQETRPREDLIPEKKVIATNRPKHPSRTIKDLGDSILKRASGISDRIGNNSNDATPADRSSTAKVDRTANQLQPINAQQTPVLAAAPAPASSRQENAAPVGSGLPAQNAVVQAAEMAPPRLEKAENMTAEFVSQPRLHSIGAASPANVPASTEDSWTSVNRSSVRSSVQPASYVQPLPDPKVRYVSAQAVNRAELETSNASIDQLQVVLSRLMSEGASAVEVQPVVDRAKRLMVGTSDQLLISRAGLIGERAEQYLQVARKRDGNTVIREQGIPTVPGPANAQDQSNVKRGPGNATGYLVQVYSARPSSPPFALTDDHGNTLVYVTPAPGVNLRMHLNSQVQIAGNRGMLTDLNMPHIYVTQASRTIR